MAFYNVLGKKAVQLKIRRMHLSHLCTAFEIISVGLRYIDERPVVILQNFNRTHERLT